MAIKVSDGQLDFLGLLNEYTDDSGAKVRVREPGGRKVFPKDPDPYMQLSFDPEPWTESEPEPKPAPVVEAPKPEPAPEPKPAPKKTPVAVPKTKSGSGGADKPEVLFKQCERCWCYDCKHNSRGPAVPRELCGKMMPCPACKGCESDGFATICEIGNAKEGCMLRATEEGIYVPEEV